MSGSHIVLLVIVVLTYSCIHTWIKQRAKRPDPSPDADEMLDKIEFLEERIQVLERIVTEHKIDLRQEIDSL